MELGTWNFLCADHRPDEILIQWKSEPSADDWETPVSKLFLRRKKRLHFKSWELWKLPHGHAMDEIVSELKNDSRIAWVEPNHLYRPMGRVPNDPLLSNEKHLEIISAYGGWEFEVGRSSPTTIAIIDTGVDISHVDLSSATSKVWTNPVDVSGGGDDDGNGKIDDLWGWDIADNDNKPTDCLGHGTLVASAASAATDNGIGVAGTSWDSKILPLKIFPSAGCDTADSADVAAAINYAVWASTRHSSYTGRMVINMSVGCTNNCASACPESALETQAIDNAIAHNIPIIAAKGNCGNTVKVLPSDYPGVIGVGATTATDSLASFSSYGSSTDIVAPGTDIYGAANGGDFGNSSDDGTSFSAPIVAGAAALILSMLPSATTTQVEQWLFNGADDLGSKGRDDYFGHGRLNLFKTLSLARYGSIPSSGNSARAIAIPNPFRILTSERVTFSVDSSVAGSNANVQIFDLGGSLIRQLTSLSWDGTNDAGFAVTSGVYLVRVKTDNGQAAGRVLVEAQ
ncbi:MAG: S8 family serine peptidase [Elusimicrobia bacterium]|nr:S8 family serine peptidase [Elusimicrobiota bacterium]